MVQSNTRKIATSVGILALVLMGAAMSPAVAVQGGDEELTDAAWYAIADDAADEIEATDWAALSAADGCVLLDLTVHEVVDAEANAAAGAPEDLVMPVVEREEDCSSASRTLTSDQVFDGDMRPAVSPGSRCAGTSGPGTICIGRSGNYVTSSWTYSGSGTIKAYLRIYKISSGASGCPSGTTVATSSTATYTNGMRRSVSVYSGYGAYSTYVWRHVGLGHYTSWGATCGIL